MQLMGLDSALSASSRVKKLAKVGGLSLPDVVRVLSKDSTVLKWDPAEFLYEVINGPKFESRSKLLFVAISCLLNYCISLILIVKLQVQFSAKSSM